MSSKDDKIFTYRGVQVEIREANKTSFFRTSQPYEYHIIVNNSRGLPLIGAENCDTAENCEAEARRVVDWCLEHPELL